MPEPRIDSLDRARAPETGPLRPRATHCFLAGWLVASWIPSGVSAAQGNPTRDDPDLSPVHCSRAIPEEQQQAAEAGLRERIPELLVARHERRGVPRSFFHPTGFLTRERPGVDPLTIAREYARKSREMFGLSEKDLVGWLETDAYRSEVSGITHLYLRQTHAGIPVFVGQMQVHVDRKGRVIGANSTFVPGLARSIGAPDPLLSAIDAVLRAAEELDVPLEKPPVVLEKATGADRRTVLAASGLSTEPIEARLRWFPPSDRCEVVLAWDLEIRTLDGLHAYELLVDAITGEALLRLDHVLDAEYQVYPQPVESPSHGERRLLVDPADPVASRFGWHDLDGSPGADVETLRGNNVHAYPDPSDLGRPASDEISCAADQSCSFPLDLSLSPARNLGAALTNAFYWTNLVHDISFAYGFDEAAGNFQEINFSSAGAGDDSLRVEVLDGADRGSRGNARFFPSEDGGRSKIELELWECEDCDPKERHSALDNGTIVHEYSHGISTRMIGGPSEFRCLSGHQQGGEGISDFLALAFTHPEGIDGDQPRGLGTYLKGQETTDRGIRTQPYSTDPSVNTKTYQSIFGLRWRPHEVGEVWAQALWEAYWALVDRHGFDPDLYDARGSSGNQRMLLYVIQGLASTPCQPTLADLRDGILQAAIANHDGEDVCHLWNVFAQFGLGIDADSANSGSTRIREGFSPPPACSCAATAPFLLGWWTMDEPELGKVHDLTDLNNGRHGSTGGGVRPGRGMVGNGLVFDRRPGRVTIRGEGRFEGLDETGFSVEAWIKPEARIVGGLLAPLWHLGEIDAPGGRSIGLSLGVDGSLRVDFHGDEHRSFSTRPDQVQRNRWAHVMVTFDGPPTYQNRIWVDGRPVAELESSFRLDRGRNDLRLGAHGLLTNALFLGRMDEVAIYRDQRTPAQIRSVAEAGNAGRCKWFCGRRPSEFDRVFQLYEDSRVLAGTQGDDLVFGSPRNDRIRGNGGADCVFGFEGEDTIRGGGGDDTLFGGDGRDEIEGDSGDDQLHGGPGNDTLRGRRGDDELYGDAGDDDAEGNEGDDYVGGGDGADNLRGRRGDDRLHGGEGDDHLQGDDGRDLLFCAGGDDFAEGGGGNDEIYGESGRDRLLGGPGADRIEGGAEADFLHGGDGADTLRGDAGDDRICGEGGADRIDGGSGTDEFRGGRGNDFEIDVETEIERADCSRESIASW